MAKSKYDRNVDKGAAQQRNAGQESTAGGYNKSGTTDEETMGTGQQSSGNPKHQGGGSQKRNQGPSGGSPGRNKHGGGNG